MEPTLAKPQKEIIIDFKKISEIKNIQNFDSLIDYIIANENEKIDKYLDIIFKEYNPIPTEPVNINKKNKLLKAVKIKVNETENINNLNPNSIFYELSQNMSISQKTDITKKEAIFKNLLSNFCLNFYLQLDNREKIYQKLIGNSKVNSNITHIVNLFKKYKSKKKFLDTCDEKIKIKAVDNMSNINISYLKDFIEIFDLKEILFAVDSPQIVKIINNLIHYRMNIKIEKIVKFIEFIIKYISEEKIVTIDLKSNINFDSLIDTSLSEKSLYGVTKRIFRIIPEQIESLVDYFLSINDTKQASDIAKDKEFKIYISENLINQIIYKANIKCMCYHYNRYFNYEIDIEQLNELFNDKPEIISQLAIKLCKANLMHECYYILKQYNFNMELIKLDSHCEKELKSFLISNYEYELTESNLDPNNKNKNKKKKSKKDKFIKLDQFNSSFLEQFSQHRSINIYPEDFFGPVTINCMYLELNSSQIAFIDSLSILDKFSNYIRNNKSSLYGIDLEWKSNNTSLEKDKGAAIMQIASKDKVFIFDIFKLNLEKEFLNKFVELFKDKIFLGFGYKGDVSQMTNEVKVFFQNCKSLDIQEIYKKKFNVNCPNLSELCKNLLNKEICKAEQVSNWERRPLRKRQLHYAALDAWILLKIYDKLN